MGGEVGVRRPWTFLEERVSPVLQGGAAGVPRDVENILQPVPAGGGGGGGVRRRRRDAIGLPLAVPVRIRIPPSRRVSS